MSVNTENAHQFPKAQGHIIEYPKKQQIFTPEKLESSTVWHFCLNTDLNN